MGEYWKNASSGLASDGPTSTLRWALELLILGTLVTITVLFFAVWLSNGASDVLSLLFAFHHVLPFVGLWMLLTSVYGLLLVVDVVAVVLTSDSSDQRERSGPR